MDDPFRGQSSPSDQLEFSVVEFSCPYCHETPDLMAEADEEGDSTVTLRPCDHTFRRADLTTAITHLRALDDLMQRHDAATTPFERQRLGEEIHAVGAELDAAAERCKTQMVSTRTT